jgi:glycolate oxidase iron-sulfur subunit
METAHNFLQSLDYAVLQQCMHCGMCLPTCPTYVKTGRERNSPRGRIALMRAIADGELETTRAFGEEMQFCVGCLACTTACPAGVDYPDLLEHARAQVEQAGVLATPARNWWRWSLMRQLFTRPRLLRAVGRMLWLYQVSGLQSTVRLFNLTLLLPKSIRALEPSAPTVKRKFSNALIAENERSTTQPARFRVAVLTGCVQDLVFSDVNRATVDVLLANGCDVSTPPLQYCCGSLHAHNGDLETARLLARRQIDAIDPAKVDAIISNAGGCGSHLKHYDRLLQDDPRYAERAVSWSKKLKDVSEWLVEIGFRKPIIAATEQTKTVTYHEACHLCHGQGISKQPREIVRAIPGLELKECAEATWCCGSAGIYSITQPETAAWLLKRKLKHLNATKAEMIVTGNPGCSLQLQNGLKQQNRKTSVMHPIVLLANAYAEEPKTRIR